MQVKGKVVGVRLMLRLLLQHSGRGVWGLYFWPQLLLLLRRHFWGVPPNLWLLQLLLPDFVQACPMCT